MVIAVPPPLVIQRYQEEMGGFQRLKRRLPLRISRHRLTERTRHPLQDRGLKQKGLDGFGLMNQHLFDQVVNNIAMAASERPDEPSDVRATVQRERSQLQSGNPALRARVQRSDLLRRKRQPAEPSEECRGLFRQEA